MNRALYVLIICITASGCGNYNKILKGKNGPQKYSKSIELYKKKDYGRAIPLFEQLREYYKGTDSMETIYYYTSYSYYQVGDYELAYQYFQDFVGNFIGSSKTAECAYMAVYCQFLTIGSYELDQSYTVKTISAIQKFIDKYPNSTYVEKCNSHIDALRTKLKKKDYEMVVQYLAMGEYRAAAVSAKNTLHSYADLEQKEELEYIAVKAQYLFAINSIEKKKAERLKEALENWKEYNESNGKTGEHYKSALDYKEKIESAIKKLKENI